MGFITVFFIALFAAFAWDAIKTFVTLKLLGVDSNTYLSLLRLSAQNARNAIASISDKKT
jgi:hypothetical protein